MKALILSNDGFYALYAVDGRLLAQSVDEEVNVTGGRSAPEEDYFHEQAVQFLFAYWATLTDSRFLADPRRPDPCVSSHRFCLGAEEAWQTSRQQQCWSNLETFV